MTASIKLSFLAVVDGAQLAQNTYKHLSYCALRLIEQRRDFREAQPVPITQMHNLLLHRWQLRKRGIEALIGLLVQGLLFGGHFVVEGFQRLFQWQKFDAREPAVAVDNPTPGHTLEPGDLPPQRQIDQVLISESNQKDLQQYILRVLWLGHPAKNVAIECRGVTIIECALQRVRPLFVLIKVLHDNPLNAEISIRLHIIRRSTRQNAAPVNQSYSYGGRLSGSYGRKAASWGSNFQRVDGRGRIGSGLAWRRTTDSQHSCRFPTLRLKICPPFGSAALLMKLACLSLLRMRCQECPTIHFTYSSME